MRKIWIQKGLAILTVFFLSILYCPFSTLSSPNSSNRKRESSINPVIFVAGKISCGVKLILFSDNRKDLIFNKKRNV